MAEALRGRAGDGDPPSLVAAALLGAGGRRPCRCRRGRRGPRPLGAGEDLQGVGLLVTEASADPLSDRSLAGARALLPTSRPPQGTLTSPDVADTQCAHLQGFWFCRVFRLGGRQIGPQIGHRALPLWVASCGRRPTLPPCALELPPFVDGGFRRCAPRLSREIEPPPRQLTRPAGGDGVTASRPCHERIVARSNTHPGRRRARLCHDAFVAQNRGTGQRKRPLARDPRSPP